MKNLITFRLILACLLLNTATLAQEIQEYNIFGYITDQNTNQPVSGVLVEVINEADTAQQSTAVSDSLGRYVTNLITSLSKTSEDIIPSEYILYQNYPNPFNPGTNILFRIPKATQIKLIIYNTLG